jgi:hypothetical protein
MTSAERRWDAVALHPDDDVATVLRDLDGALPARVRVAGAVVELALAGPVPLGHKIALKPIAVGTAVLKYGRAIGRATAPVAPGEHVHVHNLKSDRARAPR